MTALGAGATLSYAISGGNEDATVSGASGSETFIFSGTTTYTNATLGLASSGGQEYLEYNPGGFPNVTTSVTTSTTSGLFTETSGDTLLVLSGGSVSAATIDNGAFLIVSSGGQDFAATVHPAVPRQSQAAVRRPETRSLATPRLVARAPRSRAKLWRTAARFSSTAAPSIQDQPSRPAAPKRSPVRRLAARFTANSPSAAEPSPARRSRAAAPPLLALARSTPG